MRELDNSYAELPPRFYAAVEPTPVPAPTLLAWNAPLAVELGLDDLGSDREQLARLFGGNALPPGARPLAQAYAGHQFGHFVPQLGDGRAVLLGEVIDRNGVRRDVQLKGAGRTPYSRGGDGKSWLGPVIREYLVSEAMYHLGVPTTRALAAVQTGEAVLRESGPQPGGVLTRVAASHIRVGTFQYFAARGDAEGVKLLADYAIERHYPSAADSDQPCLAFFREVAAAQASLVARWLSIGFIHGVMNTDNTAVSGETIDYGPCAFMDEFKRDKVFSSIDRRGRYAYGQQPAIAAWNLARLAECLLLVDDRQADYEAALSGFESQFEDAYLGQMGRKLGLAQPVPADRTLFEQFLQHLQDNELDFTMSFRALAGRIDAHDSDAFGAFEPAWRERLSRQPGGKASALALMRAANPLFIPRNHWIESAIADSVEGDCATFRQLCEVVKKPFDEQPQLARYAVPPTPEQRVTKTFCGT